MSVDSTALERATLERKDRDELLAIAQALGGKPASRAKKADIVDLILELTGVGSGAAPEPVAAKPARARKAAAPPAESETPEAEPGADLGTEAESESESDEDDDDEADEAEVPDANAAPVRDRGDRGNQNRGDRPDRGDRGERPNQGQNGQGEQQRGQNGDRPDQGDGDGEDEGGNRRRRRRGRNRGDGQGQGQGPEEPMGDPVEVEGVVDLRDEGYGFLRLHGFLPSRDDAYISVKQARQFGLRRGDVVTGASRPAMRNEKNPALLRIDSVNGLEPDASRNRPRFGDFTAIAPTESLTADLPGGGSVAKGQRALVVGPPRVERVAALRQVVSSIEENHPGLALFVVLLDERPEEVTEWQRAVSAESSTVVATTFDRPADEHVQIAELVVERAKRLAEAGDDVVIVLDGVTRLGRANNLLAPGTGRSLPGGVDAAAVQATKRVLAAARNLEESGSVTLLGTLNLDTGSPVDDTIADELRHTANLEIRV